MIVQSTDYLCTNIYAFYVLFWSSFGNFLLPFCWNHLNTGPLEIRTKVHIFSIESVPYDSNSKTKHGRSLYNINVKKTVCLSLVKTNKPNTRFLAKVLFFQFFVQNDGFLITRSGNCFFSVNVSCRSLCINVFLCIFRNWFVICSLVH